MIVYDQYIFPEKPPANDDLTVFHAGFCSTIPNYSYGRDTRDYYLIHYCTGGKGVYNAGGQSYHLAKHDGFLILPNQNIVHTADREDPWNLCWVAFLGKKAEAYLQMAGLGSDNLIFHYDKDDYLEKCIKDIYNESRGGKNMLAILGQCYLFLARLADAYRTATQPPATHFSHFEDAQNYIQRNLHNRINVGELANYMRLDPSQVYRVFKKHTGRSPLQHVTALRINKACEMLEKTDLPIKDIAQWLNFEYQSHFTKQFKNYTGLSPGQYRQTKSLPGDI